MRYFLCLSYDGSAFCGWQIQPSSPSVQACLEETLSRLLNRPVAVTGAGRTDTGVHAVNYVAHFDTDGPLPFEASDFIYKLNAMLPHGVAIISVSEVPADMHARFSAKRREYTYFIHRSKDPFVRNYSWLCGYPSLDFDAMNKACQYLLGTHDFSCFEKTGGDNKTSICTVFEAHWEPYVPSHLQIMGLSAEKADAPWGAWPPPAMGRGESPQGASAFSDGQYWYFRIAADRFLRNMVRAVVGTLLEVGYGKISIEDFLQIILQKDRCSAGMSVPAHGLFLVDIQY